jgi:hypothetical protein
LALYQSRLDKGYSLTDCISMQTMRREGLTEVLTNDRHFEQEGFARCSAIKQQTPLQYRGACRRPKPGVSYGSFA